jgi:hypothetical protein
MNINNAATTNQICDENTLKKASDRAEKVIQRLLDSRKKASDVLASAKEDGNERQG